MGVSLDWISFETPEGTRFLIRRSEVVDIYEGPTSGTLALDTADKRTVVVVGSWDKIMERLNAQGT